MNYAQIATQYFFTTGAAIIATRDFGPIAGIAIFIAANRLWNHITEQQIARSNRKFEQRYRK